MHVLKVGDIVSRNFNGRTDGYHIGTVIEEQHPNDHDELALSVEENKLVYAGRVLIKWHNYTPDEEWKYVHSLYKLELDKDGNICYNRKTEE